MVLNGEPENKLDFAIVADTQEEPESVDKHLDRLRSLGGPPILTDAAGKLGDDLISGKNSTGGRFATIPAFTSSTPGQTGGMLRRQCTAVEVNEALRRPGTVADRCLEQAIGLHRSCPPLVEVGLGVRDVTGGVARCECEGMCGL